MENLMNFIEERISKANKDLLDGIDIGSLEKVMTNTGRIDELEIVKRFIDINNETK